jgi:ADP-heptose:LPS heptosyltransferase
VGDVVRTLPAASSLRAAYPGAHIAWLVEAGASSAVEGQSWIDEVLVFPRKALSGTLGGLELRSFARELSRFLRRLRRRRFDLVVDFHSILRSGVLSWLSGSRCRAGYARPLGRELAYLFATHRARLSPGRMSRFARNGGLVRFLGVTAPPAATPLEVDAAARLRMQAQIGSGPRPIAIHPGTSDATPHKRYSVEGYARVAQALAEEDGVPSIVTSGPAQADLALARAVVEMAAGAARLAPSTPTLGDLALLFAACRLYVGGDTGPMHVASLVGTPVLQILGPTDPVENAPYPGTPSRTVRVPLACSPCRNGCSAVTCMRSVLPASVVAAARELLAAEPQPSASEDRKSKAAQRGEAERRSRRPGARSEPQASEVGNDPVRGSQVGLPGGWA